MPIAETDADRVDALQARQEATIRQAWRQYLKDATSAAVLQAIMAKLAANDLDAAMAVLQPYIARLANVIPRVHAEVARVTVPELEHVLADAGVTLADQAAPGALEGGGTARPPAGAPPAAPDIPEASFGISFDPTAPRAAELIRGQRLDMVRDVTTSQRDAIRQALSRALLDGKHVGSTAREIGDAVGLTPYQEKAVNNYRKMLESRNRTALDRKLRDRRSDTSLRNAIERDRPLTQKQIDSMVGRYRKNYLRLRGETIARTQATRATSEARLETQRQMIEQTGIEPERVVNIWNATRDDRTRDWHASMQGQEQAQGDPFIDGLKNKLRYPGDPNAPAETIIDCRCTMTFRIKPETENGYPSNR